MTTGPELLCLHDVIPGRFATTRIDINRLTRLLS